MRPKIVRQMGALIQDYRVLNELQTVRFRCISIRNPSGKAMVFEWLDEALEAPPSLLTDDEAAYAVDQAIERAGEVERLIGFTFERHFRPRRSLADRVDPRVVRFKTLRARLSADYWQQLAPLFRSFIRALAAVDARAATEQAWAEGVLREGRRSFDGAVAQIGTRADALRARVVAQDACRHQLAIKRREWFSE